MDWKEETPDDIFQKLINTIRSSEARLLRQSSPNQAMIIPEDQIRRSSPTLFTLLEPMKILALTIVLFDGVNFIHSEDPTVTSCLDKAARNAIRWIYQAQDGQADGGIIRFGTIIIFIITFTNLIYRKFQS